MDNLLEENSSLYNEIDSTIVNEFSLGKLMEKRQEKIAFKQKLKDTLVVDRNELPKYEKEIKDAIKLVQNVIKKEVPGCKFDDNEITHDSYEKKGYEFNLYTMDIFTLNNDNFLKFASKSKYSELSNAKNIEDCSEKIIKKEINDRLVKQIQKINGFNKDPDEPWYAVKNKGNRSYITIFATIENLPYTTIDLEANIAIKLDEQRLESMERFNNLLETRNTIITELFSFSSKPKLDRDERLFMERINNKVIIDKNELSKYKKEINNIVKSVYKILKKEVPGCDFIGEPNSDISYKISNKYGYTVYSCGEVIFELDEDNFDKFKAKSKTIKNVDYDVSYDYPNEILDETENRILKPLERLGLKYDTDYGPYAYSKFKDGKRYLTVDLGDEIMFDVTIEICFAIKN